MSPKAIEVSVRLIEMLLSMAVSLESRMALGQPLDTTSPGITCQGRMVLGSGKLDKVRGPVGCIYAPRMLNGA